MLTDLFKRFCEHVPEIQLYYIIDKNGGDIWWTRHELFHNRIPEHLVAEARASLPVWQEKVEYAVGQTIRFGVDKPQNEDRTATDAYWVWFRTWDNYTKGLSDADQDRLFLVLDKIGKFLEENPGPVPEEMTQGLEEFKPEVSPTS